jgi:protein tyrosine phosphatase
MSSAINSKPSEQYTLRPDPANATFYGETPKENQLDSFWSHIWYLNTSIIVRFTDITPKNTEISCIYWPVKSSTPLSFSSGMRVTLLNEKPEYQSNNQLLIKREFRIEFKGKKKELIQLTSFPDASDSLIESALEAAKKAHTKGSALIALYSGSGKTTTRFLTSYKISDSSLI